MPLRGQILTVGYVAWDLTNNSPKSGDVANHTIQWIKDGVRAAASGTPSEVSASLCCGEYKITLTATETLADWGTVCGASSTSGITIIPTRIGFTPNWASCTTFTSTTTLDCAVYGVVRNEVLNATTANHRTVGTIGCAIYDGMSVGASSVATLDCAMYGVIRNEILNATGANFRAVGTIGCAIYESMSQAAASTAPSATANAEALLKIDMSTITGEASRSPLNALRFLVNKWFITGTTLTITKEDDTTVARTADVTPSTNASPIRGVDPT